MNAPLHFRVFLANAKFGQSCYSGGSYYRILQDDTVVNIPDVFGRLTCLRSLHT